FAAGAQVGQHRIDALLVDQPQRRVGDAQADPAVLALDPEAAVLKVRQEAALGLVVRVRDVVADHRRFSGDLADSGHDGLLGLEPEARYCSKALNFSAIRADVASRPGRCPEHPGRRSGVAARYRADSRSKEPTSMKRFLFAAALAAAAVPALAADVGVSISVGQPGFYGRIDIGRFPHPAVIYPEPVIIHPAPIGMVRRPIYL